MAEGVRQCYLQCMMQRGALRETEALDLYKKICKEFGVTAGGRTEFSEFISTVSRPLRKQLGLELVRGTMEDSGEVWYALVNRTMDSAAKIGSCYTPAELELFNKILEMIVQSSNGTASSTRILQAVPSLERKITHRDAQAFLSNLCQDNWLKEESGKFSPGPRLILELRPFLQELFGDDITICHLCKDPVIQGQKCSCGIKLHLFCAGKLFSGRAIRCPGCHSDWPHPLPQLTDSGGDQGTSPSSESGRRQVANGARKGRGGGGGGGGRKSRTSSSTQ